MRDKIRLHNLMHTYVTYTTDQAPTPKLLLPTVNDGVQQQLVDV